MRKTPKKPSNMSISIELPEGHSITTVRLDKASGKVELIDKDGALVNPKSSRREVFYERVKGRKIQAALHKEAGLVTLGGTTDLAEMESFFTIDTNTKVIGGKKISLSCFIRWKLIEGDGYFELVAPDKQAFVYEFHNIPDNENPEMLAILKLANDIQESEKPIGGHSVAFVTDCNLEAHAEISAGKRTIYGQHFLPKGFSLVYASTDTGVELLNKLLKQCDKHSARQLEFISKGISNRKGFSPTREDPNVFCVCQSFPILKLENTSLESKSFEVEASNISFK